MRICAFQNFSLYGSHGQQQYSTTVANSLFAKMADTTALNSSTVANGGWISSSQLPSLLFIPCSPHKLKHSHSTVIAFIGHWPRTQECGCPVWPHLPFHCRIKILSSYPKPTFWKNLLLYCTANYTHHLLTYLVYRLKQNTALSKMLLCSKTSKASRVRACFR